MIIATHNGSFHADDLFACAILKLLYPDARIVRVSKDGDAKEIKTADIVLDTGGIYDEKINRYDHHQRGGAGIRKNGIPYASLGLIWKHFGMKLCENDSEVWQKIEQKIVMPLDAIDNGVMVVQKSLNDLIPYFGDQPFLIFSPTWREENEKTGKHIDVIFNEQVMRVVEVIQREIKVAKDDIQGERKILSSSRDASILIVNESMPRYLYQNLLAKKDEINFIILPRSEGGWKTEAIRKNERTMESRIYFPAEWRGLRGDELKKTSGIQTADFCHNGGFYFGAGTKEDAIKAAKLALKHD